MVINKAFSIYLSPTGTTQKVALAVATGMGIPIEACDLTIPKARQAFNHSFGKDEIAIFGLPVYAGRLPKNIEDFFSGLEGNAAPAVALVLYGNRDYNDALVELRLRLEDRGFVVKAGAAFIGEHTFSKNIARGRPDNNDLAIAAEFGGKVAVSIATDITGTLNLKGNYPFVWKGYDPANPGDHPTFFSIETNEHCTQCHLCAENCPWEAIDMDDPKIINSAICMRCLRCLKNCPSSAKCIVDDKFLSFLPDFEKRLNSRRCEPELFFPQ
ncbi:4Fe-4S dicluster domain-containing protein [Chloroflexota bacterium]